MNSWDSTWGDNGTAKVLLGFNIMGIESHVEFADAYLLTLN